MQATLFGGGVPSVRRCAPPPRVDLGREAWLELWPRLVCGADALFEQILDTTDWASQRREMYGQLVEVPRLLGRPAVPLPVVDAVAARLGRHTGWCLDRVSLALYRDGRDSVAWHGDRMGELKDDCVVAILSLGAVRTLRLRPVGGGSSRAVPLHAGDCLVLGGTAQRTWEHAVLKVRAAGPRIAVMLRPSAPPR
jgi:alkylated DNA repair dioxygenase AlkB